jgi:hypothetical protein
MKRFYFLLCAGLLAWTTFSACQKEEAPVLEPRTVAQTASCEEPATVKANDCGFYLQMNDGSKVFATSYRGFEMKEGAEVRIGFDLPYDSTHASSSSSSSGNCGDGGMEDPDPTTLEGCMRANGVSQVRITCIQSASPSPSSE